VFGLPLRRRAVLTQFHFIAHFRQLTQIPLRRNARSASEERRLKNTQDMGSFVMLMAAIGIILLMSTVVGASILNQR
jgi:hypothetical protein